MKKLKKLKLQNAVLLKEEEMKVVTGGTYGYGGSWNTYQCTCDGTGEVWYCLGESTDCVPIDTCKGFYFCSKVG